MIESLRLWLIGVLGGYTNPRQALLAVTDGEEKHRLLTEAIKHLYCTIGADDILHADPTGAWIFEGKPISDGRKKLLAAEAVNLLQGDLWRVLVRDIEYQTNKKMFELSKNIDDLVAGKLWVYNIDALRTRLTSLSKGKGTFNS